jgi:hypothetical protein
MSDPGALDGKADDVVSSMSVGRWSVKLFKSPGASTPTSAPQLPTRWSDSATEASQEGGDLDRDCMVVLEEDTIAPQACAEQQALSAGRVAACVQQVQRARAELQACAALKACAEELRRPASRSMPLSAVTGGVGPVSTGRSRSLIGPLPHRRPQRFASVSAFHRASSLSAQWLSGAPNTMTRTPSSPSPTTPRSSPSGGPSLLMLATPRAMRTSASSATPRTPSSPSFIAQFKPLLDPTIVAMLDRHSLLQAEAAKSRCALVAGLDPRARSTQLPTSGAREGCASVIATRRSVA